MSQAMLSYTKDDAKSVVKVDKSTEPVVPVEKAIKVESYATDAPSADGTPKMTKVARWQPLRPPADGGCAPG